MAKKYVVVSENYGGNIIEDEVEVEKEEDLNDVSYNIVMDNGGGGIVNIYEVLEDGSRVELSD